jgi:PAS domain S-box-containing protein
MAIAPIHSFALHSGADALGLGLFVGIGAMISWLNEALHAAHRSTVFHLHRLEGEIAERHRTEAARQVSQNRLELALDAANAGIWEWGPATAEPFFGPRFHKILGYEPGELLGAGNIWANQIHPDERLSIEQQLAEQIERQHGMFGVECRMRAKTGEYIWVQTRGKVIDRTSDGNPARLAGMIIDITERKNLEVQLQHSQRLDSIGRLAGGVAHDFNNLLTVINGYAAMVSAELPRSSPLQESINEIRTAGERAASLTHQLLAFSRKQVLQPTVLKLNHIVAEIEKMLRRLLGENIVLVTILAADIGNITADAGQLQQVLMNLAVNSKDAMPSGGRLLIETMNVQLDESYTAKHPQVQPGDYVMLAVSDTGSGMSPEVKDQIFEPFFTTKAKGSGTGLGLATVYGIVKQTGGWIWVYSEPGRGTTVKLYFPRTGEPLSERQVFAKTDAHGTETILVVEDQADVRRLAVSALQRYGYIVHAAANAEEAIRFCDEHHGALHLVLTDVVMPGKSGYDLASTIAQVRPDVRIVFMSGYTDNAITHQGVLDEGIAYIQKPFTPQTLAEKIRQILESS